MRFNPGNRVVCVRDTLLVGTVSSVIGVDYPIYFVTWDRSNHTTAMQENELEFADRALRRKYAHSVESSRRENYVRHGQRER